MQSVSVNNGYCKMSEDTILGSYVPQSDDVPILAQELCD